ncbi:transposase [Seinonella peptonophila]|uniref:transposase n=1 Tax=Seinonella peptonophila TaxID=112248 RepID=UPI003BF487C1
MTNQHWKIIQPLLPKKITTMGRPMANARKVLNGILYVLKTGCAWVDMPRKYSSYTTCMAKMGSMGTNLEKAITKTG